LARLRVGQSLAPPFRDGGAEHRLKPPSQGGVQIVTRPTQPLSDTTDLRGNAWNAGAFAPFAYPAFAMIWSASFVANFGTVIHTMAAAWLMAHLVASPVLVTLVQTATSAPTMLLALFTGATADRFGRRRQMLAAQGLALASGVALTCTALEGILTPTLLLLFAFLLGLAQAIYLPAWQSSIGEQVPRPVVPSAIAFNAIGLNTARCVGPMLGGLILVLFGPPMAFGLNTLGFACVLAALWAWRVPVAADTARSEPFWTSLRAGLGYGFSHLRLRATYVRCALFSICAVCPFAFLPLIARDLIGGGVGHYTIVQSMFGIGAVLAGVALNSLRGAASLHRLALWGSLLIGGAMMLTGANIAPWITIVSLFPVGVAWVVAFSVFNIATQIEAPPAMVGRLLAIYQTTVSLGLALGSALWGEISHFIGIRLTLILAGAACVAIQIILSGRLGMADGDGLAKRPAGSETP